MTHFTPTHPLFVSYIDKSRQYYLNKGFGNPYRWATHSDTPFTPLPKPLNQCRIGLITTAARNEAGGRNRQVYAAPTTPHPTTLYTNHLFWHKTATHTRDLNSYLPLQPLQALAAANQIGSLSPRFYGVPTKFSQRQTNQEHAPAILNLCQEDEVDVALLIPL